MTDAPRMAYTDKTIMIQTDQGQVYVSPDFLIEYNIPIHGFVCITDKSDNRIFWFNFNAISWIGPRT